MGRLEEAVNCHRQAAGIYRELDDLRWEGAVRSNLAYTLIKLGRLDEARPAIERAIACDEPFGHLAEPWKTWDILHKLASRSGVGGADQQFPSPRGNFRLRGPASEV